MEPITRDQLKREIDTLDTSYLDLAYRVLQQFPHTNPRQGTKTQPSENISKTSFSQRWRGKLGSVEFTTETLATDPRLAYLAERYKL